MGDGFKSRVKLFANLKGLNLYRGVDDIKKQEQKQEQDSEQETTILKTEIIGSNVNDTVDDQLCESSMSHTGVSKLNLKGD